MNSHKPARNGLRAIGFASLLPFADPGRSRKRVSRDQRFTRDPQSTSPVPAQARLLAIFEGRTEQMIPNREHLRSFELYRSHYDLAPVFVGHQERAVV